MFIDLDRLSEDENREGISEFDPSESDAQEGVSEDLSYRGEVNMSRPAEEKHTVDFSDLMKKLDEAVLSFGKKSE